jgi:hypothetical protein
MMLPMCVHEHQRVFDVDVGILKLPAFVIEALADEITAFVLANAHHLTSEPAS